MQKTVHKWQKNAAEEVRISLDEFKGMQLINIRVYALSVGGQGEAKPTAKGVAVRIEQLPELMRGMEKVKEELDGPLGG